MYGRYWNCVMTTVGNSINTTQLNQFKRVAGGRGLGGKDKGYKKDRA
jgi:hypothetical protein